MTKRAMPMLLQDGKFLEFRNSAGEPLAPSVELKNGEDARRAAMRAADELLGLEVPEDCIKEGFQARVGTEDEVVAVFPVDASKMDLGLLRPAEAIADWAWKDVPDSMGNVVALGFPRNLGERRNSIVGQPPSNPDDLNAYCTCGHEGFDHERTGRCDSPGCGCIEFQRKDKKGRTNGTADGGDTRTPGLVTARVLIQGEPGSQILAARQNDGRLLLPGGHIEEGEDPRDAAIRELQEEFGIDIAQALTGESYEFNGDDGSRHIAFIADGAKIDANAIVPGDDVAEAELVDAPFTDAHGAVHEGRHGDRDNAREHGDEAWKNMGPTGRKVMLASLDLDLQDDEMDKLSLMPFESLPGRIKTAFRAAYGRENDQAGEVEEIERHVEGIEHELGELERENKESIPTDCQGVPGQSHQWKKVLDGGGRYHFFCDRCRTSTGPVQGRMNASGDVDYQGFIIRKSPRGGYDVYKGRDHAGEAASVAEAKKLIAYLKDKPEWQNAEHDNAVSRFERICPACDGMGVVVDQNVGEVACKKCKGTGVETVSKLPKNSSDATCATDQTELPEETNRRNHIEELEGGKFRLLSHEGKNLGTFDSRAAAEKHEREVQGFKHRGNAADADIIRKWKGNPHVHFEGHPNGTRIAFVDSDGETVDKGSIEREVAAGRDVTIVLNGDDDHQNDLDAGDHGHELGEEVSPGHENVAPPGGEAVVKALKKEPGVDNPFAVAWAMKDKGQI